MWSTSAVIRELSHSILRRFPRAPVHVLGDLSESQIRILNEFDSEPLASHQSIPRGPTVKDDSEKPKTSLSIDKNEILMGFDVLARLEDIWRFLRDLRRNVDEKSHIVFVHTNLLWRPLLQYLEKWQNEGPARVSWLSHIDIENLCELNGFEMVSFEDRIFLPWRVPFLTSFLNNVLGSLPLLRRLGMYRVYFLRPVPGWKACSHLDTESPSVSIVVPCKDEKGNIRRCVDEIEKMGSHTEVLFVEGGSTDGTKDEIEEVIRSYQGPLDLKVLEQRGGKGKGPAVRTGFEEASQDIFMILDSDLTVRPMELPKFYTAMVEGKGDFIMGSRLVYPLEKQAMRTLNIFGNKFFSILFSWILDQSIKDTLCGTKVLWKEDYRKISEKRSVFGDFDPFGDFDLIFGAAFQCKKIREIPIRYQSRTYGDTKISRFSHGWLLLKMSVFGFKRFKLGR